MTETHRMMFVCRPAVALMMCLGLAPFASAERPAVPPGHVRYIVVVRDASTIPHPADQPGPTGFEPGFEGVGARVEHSRGEVRVVTLPEPAVELLKLDPAVLFVQKVWDGRPWTPPPTTEQSRVELTPGSDSTEVIGSDQKISWSSGDYQYDPSGNIWAVGAERHYYDHVGRIIQSTVRSQTESHSYDAFGNLVGKTTPGFTSTLPEVDPDTNRWKTYSYDAAGNLTAGDRDTYTYDSLNMMVKIGGTSFPPRFIYTPDDERIGIQQNDGWTRWKIRDFGGRVIREYEGDTGNSWLWIQDYVYADGRLVAGIREPTRGGSINFHTDHLGSVRLITNENGWKLSAQEYWPFGQEQTPTNQEATVFAYTRPEPMKFTSHERDYLGAYQYDNIDYLDYMHAREYSPLRGRFLSVDPVLDVSRSIRQPQSWNRYSYCINNPVNRTDPDGRVDGNGMGDRPDFPEDRALQLAMDQRTAEGTAALSAGFVSLLAGGQGAYLFATNASFRFNVLLNAAGMGLGMTGAPTPSGTTGEVLKRGGMSYESATRLGKRALEAEASNIKIHGVSVTAGTPARASSQATRAAVEAQFKVHNTPTANDPLHRTVELPKPVTKRVADWFNELFGRTK